jgi:hypothetical protein
MKNKQQSGHNKGGQLGALKGLMETKHFGAKHGTRHNNAKTKALKKLKGESTNPF